MYKLLIVMVVEVEEQDGFDLGARRDQTLQALAQLIEIPKQRMIISVNLTSKEIRIVCWSLFKP